MYKTIGDIVMSQPRSPSSASSSSESKEPSSPNSPSAGSVAPEIVWSDDKVEIQQFATRDPKKNEMPEFKPLVAFNYISEMLTQGLVGLTLNFLEDKEKKNAEQLGATLSAEIVKQGDAGGKKNGDYYSRTGGILALSAIPWIKGNEQDVLNRFGIATPPTQAKDFVDTYFKKDLIMDLIRDKVQPKYQAALTQIVDLVYTLVNFSTIPPNVRDFAENTKKPGKPEERLFRGSDETLNAIIPLLNASVTQLLALKEATKKMDQINQSVTRLNKGIDKISLGLKNHEQAKSTREIQEYKREIEALKQQTADTAAARSDLSGKMKVKEQEIIARDDKFASEITKITAVNEHLSEENALLKQKIAAALQEVKKEESQDAKRDRAGEDKAVTQQIDTDMLMAENVSLRDQYEKLVQNKAAFASEMGDLINESKEQRASSPKADFPVDRAYLDNVSASLKEYYAANPGKVDTARRAPRLEVLLEKIETAVKLGDANQYKEGLKDLKKFVNGLMKGETYGTFHFIGKHDKGLDSILEKRLGKPGDESSPDSSPKHRM
jgi:hypothetical protein